MGARWALVTRDADGKWGLRELEFEEQGTELEEMLTEEKGQTCVILYAEDFPVHGPPE